MKVVQSELTPLQIMKALKALSGEKIYTDENCQLPKCLHDDFQEWLIGVTQQADKDGRHYISDYTSYMYISKVIEKGISYSLYYKTK